MTQLDILDIMDSATEIGGAVAPLDNIDDCVRLEIPLTFVVTYDKAHESREKFSEASEEAQTLVLRQRIERAALRVVDLLNALDAEDIVFGVRLGGEE